MSQEFKAMPFRNSILGPYSDKEKMESDIKESGIVWKNGQWFIPTEIITASSSERGHHEAGDKIFVVAKKYLDFLKNKRD